MYRCTSGDLLLLSFITSRMCDILMYGEGGSSTALKMLTSILTWTLVLGYISNLQNPPFPPLSLFHLYRPKYGYIWVASCGFSIGCRNLVCGKKSMPNLKSISVTVYSWPPLPSPYIKSRLVVVPLVRPVGCYKPTHALTFDFRGHWRSKEEVKSTK